jgi:hypothetical protein
MVSRVPRGCTNPAACAYAAASVRVSAPSLARMWETWTLAVFGEMNSRAAIAQFVAPEATRQSTSRSRSVSDATFCSADPNRGRTGATGRGRVAGSAGGANCTSSQPWPSSRTESQPRTTCSRAATRS